ncbi:hypothetical protein BOX15_Mlig004291g4, partial [Macrostomum lignano]
QFCIMGGQSSKPQQRVLIAVDGSSHSQNAFDWYRTNLATPGEDVILFHTGSLPNYLMAPTGISASDSDVQRANESLRKRVAQLEESMMEQCKRHSMQCRWKYADSLSPGPAVVDASAEEKADLVVMGTRGLGTIRRTILGSVSEFVSSHSRRPVVVVPPPPQQ